MLWLLNKLSKLNFEEIMEFSLQNLYVDMLEIKIKFRW